MLSGRGLAWWPSASLTGGLGDFFPSRRFRILPEGLIMLWKITARYEVLPLPRMKYDVAMALMGLDKPDTRFEMLAVIWQSYQGVALPSRSFSEAPAVKAIVAKMCCDKYSQGWQSWQSKQNKYGAKGLAWVKVADGKSWLVQLLSSGQTFRQVCWQYLQLENNDLVLFVADTFSGTNAALGALRVRLAKELDLIDPDTSDYLGW